MFAIAFITSLFILSLFLTGCIRRYAISANLLDIPNHRSSHSIPTPRGGGLGFVICFLSALLFLAISGFIPQTLAWALGGAGFFVAFLGFLDDKISLPARWRLLGHIAAALFALACLDNIPQCLTLSWPLSGFVGLFYLVWLLNLYNFMDGIDGIAGTEALTVCLGAALMYGSLGAMDLSTLPLILAAVVAGFLFWNLPPARIFMGDAGSGFLGIILGILSIYSASVDTKFLWGWLILLGVFIVDASITLIRRALGRQGIFQAHCSHAYQRASRQFGAHLPVTAFVALINIFWLLPMALLVVHNRLSGLGGLVLAWLPLAVITFYFKAGSREQ